MRKNKMMRAASALLVAVLLTTSTISGTFAKYVTTNEAKDVARVAKWGVELQVAGNLFGENYVNTIALDDALSKDLAVESKNNFNAADAGDPDDVVAPGTWNSDGFTFSINGTPEVSGQIKIDKLQVQNIYLAKGTYGMMVPVAGNVVTAENFDEFDALYKYDTDKYVKATAFEAVQYFTYEDEVELTDVYYPVKFTLGGTTTNYTPAAVTNVDTLAEIAALVAGKVQTGVSGSLDVDSGITTFTLTGTKQFAPNTTLSTLGLENERLTWAWAFEGQNDGADTILGNLMANVNTVVKPCEGGYELLADKDYCLNLLFDLQISVEQIDGIATP